MEFCSRLFIAGTYLRHKTRKGPPVALNTVGNSRPAQNHLHSLFRTSIPDNS